MAAGPALGSTVMIGALGRYQTGRIAQVVYRRGSGERAGPRLPRLDAAEVARRAGRPFDAPGVRGGGWRAVAVPIPREVVPAGGSVVVAAPRAERPGPRAAGLTAAATGEEAVAAAARVRPDLVLLDVMLPDLDGFSVIARLRERGGPVPVLFVTARDAPADKVRGLTAGGATTT
ncbi:response regulator [Actinomadura sp. B10D3]|uniref:response regulator n=1 Tax=Actinomadura sp. B10D3 TaxID=3153557 RepID=UPI00325F5A04